MTTLFLPSFLSFFFFWNALKMLKTPLSILAKALDSSVLQFVLERCLDASIGVEFKV